MERQRNIPFNIYLIFVRSLVASGLIFLQYRITIISATELSDDICPPLKNVTSLQQSQLIQRLTHSCRYDRLERPIEYDEEQRRLPTRVKARIYIYYMHNLNSDLLQFKMHALLQLNFVDLRLAFQKYAPERKENILGQKHLSERLWLPHIFFSNERESSILGTDEKDVLTSISPEGRVIISTRLQATLYCWMNFKKFPFDEQYCSTVLESWMYNITELILEWEEVSPISFDPELRLTEYNLQRYWYNETTVVSNGINLRHGAFNGNYSSLSFTLNLNREIGFYLMDYFLPSMMIVAISWVSFWLQADASPPRIMLGTSTMLSFITLSSSQSKTLPKVSYIKVSEVWFLGCTFFIFGSLVEFAFVNTIWRRKENIELKKVNSKYIIKSTLTPRPTRRQVRLSNSKAHSCSSLDQIASGTNCLVVNSSPNLSVNCNRGNINHSTNSSNTTNNNNSFNNHLTVHNIPMISMQLVDDLNDSTSSVNHQNTANEHIIDIGNEETTRNLNENSTFTTMTPQEIAMWIDRRSRFLFPVTFLAFNALYWTFVYCF